MPSVASLLWPRRRTHARSRWTFSTPYQFFSQWTPPDPSEPAPFLSGLEQGQVIEDMMVSHDAKAMPGWFPEPENLIGVVKLSRRDGTEHLTIVNANRTSIETTLGVDLVYYLHSYRSFVMVQYKRMRA